MTTKADHRVVGHTINRIDIVTGIEFDDFIAAFEKAAPPFDPATVQAIIDRGGGWDDVLAAAAINAPNDLMVYAKIDALPLLGLAGHTTKAVEYLLGNHTIAETMFRHDPRALLYAPLRLLIYADVDGNAVVLHGPAQRRVRQPRHRGGHQGGREPGPQSGKPVAAHRG